MANKFEIKEVGKNIGELAKKNPTLVYVGIGGAFILGTVAFLRNRNTAEYTEQYIPPMGDIKPAEGLTEDDILDLLNSRDDYLMGELADIFAEYDAGFANIINTLDMLDTNQGYNSQNPQYHSQYPDEYFSQYPVQDYREEYPAMQQQQKDGISLEQFNKAIHDISINEALMFSEQSMYTPQEVLDIADWSNLYISAQKQGIATTKDPVLAHGKMVSYYPGGHIAIHDVGDAPAIPGGYTDTIEGRAFKLADSRKEEVSSILGSSNDTLDILAQLEAKGYVLPGTAKGVEETQKMSTSSGSKSSGSSSSKSSGSSSSKSSGSSSSKSSGYTISKSGDYIADGSNAYIPAGTNLSNVRV